MSSTPPTLQDVLSCGSVAYNCLSQFEVARYKVLRHCNMLPRGLSNFSPPQTRLTSRMYTVELTSQCPVCNSRHVNLSHKTYLLHFAALPFRCEHKQRVDSMKVVENDERTQPWIMLPPQLSKIAPDCMSESSGGMVTIDKLEKIGHDFKKPSLLLKKLSTHYLQLSAMLGLTSLPTHRMNQIT